MCGIIGYVGDKKALDVILEGLKRLEYRGYDSSGFALLEGESLLIEKKEGKLAKLKEEIKGKEFKSKVGIGHTRWATHGKVDDVNAHPHTDCTGDIAIIHNGIIENFEDLKNELIQKGHIFKSKTDTEVMAHLIEEELKFDDNIKEASRKAALRLEGAFAFLILSKKHPDRIVAIRYFSPLILGVGEGENIFASDIPALLDYTKKIIPLHDGDVVEITKEGFSFCQLKTGEKIERSPMLIQWSATQADKQGFKHYMLKEIFEQPSVIRETLKGRIEIETGEVTLNEFKDLKIPSKIQIVAAGTSFHASLVGKYLIESLAKIPVEVDYSSEYRYREPVIIKDTLLISVTQSGETADTLAAMRLAKEKSATIMVITNRPESSAARDSDIVFVTQAGIEVGVAATKSYIAQLVAFYLIAAYLAQKQNFYDGGFYKELIFELSKLSQKVETLLEYASLFDELSKELYKVRDIIYVGRGIDFPTALEGALKMKELSYIHAEGYAAGELKHGPIALLEPDVPIIGILNSGKLYEKVFSNLQESKARLSPLFLLTDPNDERAKTIANYIIPTVKTLEILNPVVSVVPLQLLAYYVADRKGFDVDQPRNLAKSVTVE